MERQSSFGSESSAGSAFSGRSAGTRGGGKDHGKAEVEELQQKEQLMKALFGSLYTLAKEKINDSANMAYLTIFIDFILICCLFLMPEYPWAADAHHPIYKVFFYVEFHLPIAHTGYRFYLIIFYILVATLFISTGICIWVGWCFKNDSFPFLWPIKVARIVVSVFVSIFYIASLNIFLIALQCEPEYDATGHRHWVHLIYHLDCLSMPHVIHAAFSLVSSVLFFVVALLLVVADHELQPMSRSLLAAPHSMTELRMLLCKTVITVADILLRPAPHTQVTIYFLACLLMLWFQLRWAPHLSAWINCLRAGLNSILAWVSLTLMAMTYHVKWIEDDASGSHTHFTWEPWSRRFLWTMLMAGGLPVVFFGGMAAMYLRLYCAWRTALKFSRLGPGVKPRSIHTFWDDFDVEVAARIGRIFDAEGNNMDPAALDIAENVLKAGVAMYPNSPYLRIVYSNFLIEVRKNNSSGWAQLEMARKLEPNLSYQFSIFTREQEHKQQAAAGSSGQEAVDLVSYVEFQKNYRSLLEYHKAALEATRDFWRMVMRDTVPMASMSRMFARIDLMEVAANRTYRLVLERYPKSAKLLRSYGRFLENVKNDPWGAAKYYAEAEKQEELAESAAPELTLLAGEEGETNASMLAAINDKNNAVLSVNAIGIIQMANKAAQRLLGYKKGELEGKNVNILMPPPYSTRHNGYLKNYQTSGKANILDETVEVVALHKERYIFPVTIAVTKASGSGADATFMSVMKPATSAPDEIKAFLLPAGSVLCVDQSFMDYAGWGPQELVGKPFSSLSVDPGELESMLGQASKCTMQELKQGAVTGRTQIKHKYGGEVGVSLKFYIAGSEAQRIFVVSMKRLEEPRIMLAVDHKGRLAYANTGLAAMLGYKLAVLRAKEFSALLPPPFNLMHSKWIKDAETLETRQAAGSCRSGATVHLVSSNGTAVPVKASISHHPGTLGQGATWAVSFTRSTEAAAADERRLLLRVKVDGTVVGVSSGTPSTLFGWDPLRLVGTRLEALVDIFYEYAKDGREVGPALTSLLMRSNSQPGSSWRVGVGKVEEAEAEAAARAADAEGARTIMRQVSRHGAGKVKAAVMVVAVAGAKDDEAGNLSSGADEGNTQEDGAALVLELWRADLLSGVVELGPNCSIVRADPAAGRLFGSHPASMMQHHLYKYLALAPTVTLEDMMGITSTKKGGMKKSHAHRVGPVHQLQGVHADGRTVGVSLQAVLKDGSSMNRLSAVVKLTQPSKGAPRMLDELIAAEQKSSGGAAAGERDSSSERAAALVAGAECREGANSGKVPGLPLGKVALLGADGAATTRRGTGRSEVNDPTTARGVEVDLGPLHERGRAGQAKAHVGGAYESEEGEAAERGINISESGSGGEGDPREGTHKQHLTEEEREAELAAKGSRKARAWLESGFHHTADQEDEEIDLPGVVPGGDEGTEGASEGPAVEGAAGEQPAGADAAGGLGAEAAAAASQSDVTSAAGDSAHIGDFARGRRLRKLLRLINSRVTMQTLGTFKGRMLLMSFGVLLLHIAAFVAMLVSLANETTYVNELNSSGSIIDVMHRSLSYARILEAAQRGCGYSESDMTTYAALLADQIDKFEVLHQGLYLGFKGLRAINDPKVHQLWHDPLFNATYFAQADAGGGTTTETDSLFNLGTAFTAAGREVAYVGTHSSSQVISEDTNWMFMQANGPTSLHSAYLHSLNLMTLRAQRSITRIQTLVLILLGIEGFGVCAGSVALVLVVLRALMHHRSGLFSVFLAIPNVALRTLANKSTNIGDEDEESDDEEARAADTEAEAKKSKHKAAQDEEDRAAATGSGGDAGGDTSKSPSGTGGRRRVSIVGKASGAGTGDSTMVRGLQGLDTLMSVDLQTRKSMLFNGKHLEPSSMDMYRLVWPFMLWGMLVMIVYGTTYASMDNINKGVIAVKLGQRSLGQASRVAYYVGEVVLGQNTSTRAALQAVLAREAQLLDSVYWVHLYGGPTMPDSIADGSHDDSDGALFRSAAHAQLLFKAETCLRADQQGCFTETSPWYAVTHSGVDPMMRRLVDEAGLLARDNVTSMAPDDSNSRYAYVWSVANWDLHDGMADLVQMYVDDVLADFNRERVLQIALVVVAAVSITAFLLVLFRPFLRQVTKEGRRVAELLVQLPPEMDLETLVAALTASGEEGHEGANEQTGLSLARGRMSTGGSIWKRLSASGQTPAAPLMGGAAGFGGGTDDTRQYQPSWGKGEADGDRFFSPRGQPEPQQRSRFLRGAAESQGSGSGMGGQNGGWRFGPRGNAEGGLAGENSQLGGGGMRRRPGVGRRVVPE